MVEFCARPVPLTFYSHLAVGGQDFFFVSPSFFLYNLTAATCFKPPGGQLSPRARRRCVRPIKKILSGSEFVKATFPVANNAPTSAFCAYIRNYSHSVRTSLTSFSCIACPRHRVVKFQTWPLTQRTRPKSRGREIETMNEAGVSGTRYIQEAAGEAPQ